MQRGEIWWARLPSPRGSEPGYERPVLIVQSDAFNKSQIRTLLATVITSNTLLAEAPANVPLTRRQSGLPKPSVVNLSQVVTLDKAYLGRRVRRISPRLMEEVEAGLRLVLGL